MKDRIRHLLGLDKRNIPKEGTQVLVPNLVKVSYERTFFKENRELTYDAKIILADLMQQAGMSTTVVYRKVDGSISTEDLLINEGKKLMVLGILNRLYSRSGLGDNLSPDEQEKIATQILEDLTIT